MATEVLNQVDPRWTDRESIQECMTRAVQRALKMHKALGVPIVVERDGKMVKIPPEEIVIPEVPTR